MSHHISTDRSKHYLKWHLILVAKYRGNILVGQLNDDLKSVFQSIADNPDFEIEVFESDVNHIHFLIRHIPRLSIAQIVRRLKQESTHQLWLQHRSTLRRYYWYRKILCPDGYFACSIGEASASVGFTLRHIKKMTAPKTAVTFYITFNPGQSSTNTHSPFSIRGSACLYFTLLLSPDMIFLMVTLSFLPIFGFSLTTVSVNCRLWPWVCPAALLRAESSSLLGISSLEV